MHSLYRIVVGDSQYTQSAVKLMMKTVAIILVGTSSLSAILIATTHVNHAQSLYVGAK